MAPGPPDSLHLCFKNICTKGISQKELRTRRMRRTTNKDEQQQEEGKQRT
jgi:hypothetical protein